MQGDVGFIPPPRAAMQADRETTGTVPSFSFPAHARLRLRGDIQRVYRHGRRARGTCMGIVALHPSPDGSFKATVSARKKEMRRAVDRNRARRRVRETIRLHRHALVHDVWLMVLAHAAAREASWAALADEFGTLCARACLLGVPAAPP
jgi:ribonuclease P protein component